MKIKKLAILSLIVALFGCQTHNAVDYSGGQKQLCEGLKRQILYNSYNKNVEAAYTTESQKQHVRDLYDANHCDQYFG